MFHFAVGPVGMDGFRGQRYAFLPDRPSAAGLNHTTPDGHTDVRPAFAGKTGRTHEGQE